MSATYPHNGLKGASPADLAWMSGVWRGRNGEDAVEECWSEPEGDTLLGMFRWTAAGKVKFYEIAAIERAGDFVFLRIKHFDPGLIGWEKRKKAFELRLVYNENREAAFIEIDRAEPRWAVYRRPSADVMLSYFTRLKEPLADPGLFEYRRRRFIK